MMPIIIVDDEPLVLSFVKNQLSRDRFSTIEAHDGPNALSAVREAGGKIAALLTDIEMMGMSGITLAKTVTAEFPNIPVLFMSAVATSNEELERDVPGCAVVQKPFVGATLVQSLRNLLARQEQTLRFLAEEESSKQRRAFWVLLAAIAVAGFFTWQLIRPF
jgi:CheY-like chemotaxis protein